MYSSELKEIPFKPCLADGGHGIVMYSIVNRIYHTWRETTCAARHAYGSLPCWSSTLLSVNNNRVQCLSYALISKFCH